MKVRSLVHVHSVISFDGTLTLSEIRDLAIGEGFGAVFITEHIEHLTTTDMRRLINECEQLSSSQCVLIPGLEIEEQCQYFLGLTRPLATQDTADLRRQLIASGSIPILAHQLRSGMLRTTAHVRRVTLGTECGRTGLRWRQGLRPSRVSICII